MAKRRDERPAKIVAPTYEETTIAQKPGVAEDNEERTRFDRTAKNNENQTVKEWSKGWTKRMATRKTLYWAHGDDSSKADHAWAKRLTADHARALVVNCVKYLFNLI